MAETQIPAETKFKCGKCNNTYTTPVALLAPPTCSNGKKHTQVNMERVK